MLASSNWSPRRSRLGDENLFFLDHKTVWGDETMKQRAVIIWPLSMIKQPDAWVESHASGIKTLKVEQKQCKSKVNE